MTDSDIVSQLRGIPLFAELDADEFAQIARGCTLHQLKRGQILFQKGDAAHGFYLLLEGQVKLALLAADGHEMVVELIQPGGTFGEAVIFIDKPYPAYAESLGKGRVLYVAREPLLLAVRGQPDFAMRLLAGLSLRLHTLVREIEKLATQNALQRVIGYLLALHADTGASAVRLPAGKAVIAARLNLTPETFSRMLHTLQERMLVAVDGRDITLHDLEALRRSE